MEEVVKYLKALTVLQLEAFGGRAGTSKPEVLLAKSGFSHKEISELLGKSQMAVAKTISRARNAKGTEELNDE